MNSCDGRVLVNQEVRQGDITVTVSRTHQCLMRTPKCNFYLVVSRGVKRVEYLVF